MVAIQSHSGEVAALAFAPDGRKLFSGGSDQTVREWDVAAGAQLAVIRGDVPRPVEIGRSALPALSL
jgi:WD40 repeat protein